ncbi:MAG: PEGA domain-containing protein, partial [Verrucomicrobia bacterium]|nr:PEGA domain-containing protein [Verrucomicrobiota bacterium]
TETPAKSNRPLAIGLAAVLAVAGIAGWYFGIHAPEQRRLEAEAIRLANARGGIVVQTEPAGAEISVGGVEIKQSPATFKELRLGSYEVKASKPGYEPETFQLKVEENRFADPGRVSLKPMVGTVAVATTPAGVNYTLTSKRLTLQELAPVRYDGHTPAKVEGLPIGEYRLTLHRDGWQDQESLVEVGRGKTANCNGDFSGGSLRIGMAAGQSDVGYRAIRDHALGRVVRTGAAPAQLDDLPPGNYSVTFERAGWSAVNQSVSVEPGKLAALEAAFASGNLEIASQPEGADFELSGGPVAKSPALAVLKQGEGRVAEKNGASVLVGKTPAKLDGLPVGRYTVTLRGANGWPAQMREVDVVTGGAGARVAGNFSPAKLIVESDPSGAEVWVGGKMLGKTPYTDPSIGPGKREVELRLAGYLVSRASGEAQPGAEVCLGGKLEPYLSAEIGDAAYEQNRAEALAALERGTADAKARAFVESDYWVRRAETLAASLSGKPQVDDTLSLLGFWAERGVASRVDQCGNFVLQRIGQMDEPSSLAGTLTTLNEQGYRDLCARFAAIAPETLKKEKNAVYSAGSLMEALWTFGDKDSYAQVFASAQDLVKTGEYPAIHAENLLETVWKLGDKAAYAQAFALAQELTRKDSSPAIQVQNLLETV